MGDLEAVVKYLVSEEDVIAQAPIMFLLAAALVSIFVWRVLVWRYSATIENLESRNKLLTDRISDYEAKLKGASPDEAKARLDVLEATIANFSPRSLSAEQFENLKTQLLTDPGRANIVLAVTATSKVLHADLERCFREAGYEVHTWVGMEQKVKSSEISFKVPNVDQLTTRQTLVLNALTSVNLNVVVESEADHPANACRIDIWLTVR